MYLSKAAFETSFQAVRLRFDTHLGKVFNNSSIYTVCSNSAMESVASITFHFQLKLPFAGFALRANAVALVAISGSNLRYCKYYLAYQTAGRS